MKRNPGYMPPITGFFIGLLFGTGLILSGMTDPGKVIGFLDLRGAWDPSLGLVMAGAIAVSAIAFRIARRRNRTLAGGRLELPSNKTIDGRLAGGSLAFGIGWGLAGFCPGPALVSLTAGHAKAALFVLAMLAGMAVFELMERARRTPGGATGAQEQ